MNLLNVGMNPQMRVSFVSATCESEELDFTTKLKTFRVRNIDRINIAHISIHSIRGTF